MTEREGLLARAAARFTAWAEKWLPDAFIFALIATVIVVTAAFVKIGDAKEVVTIWGNGFWELLPFTLQMALVIITGSVVASAQPVERLIVKLAGIPTTPRGAVAFVAFFAMASSWFNWGFSLIFSAMLAKEVAKKVPTADYKAVCASAFLGLGSIWAQGLSGSAALQMATPSALPASLKEMTGVIPLTQTIFLWQSLVSVAVEIFLVTVVMYFAAPKIGAALTPTLSRERERGSAVDAAKTPGEWLEHQPYLSVIFVALAGAYLVITFAKGDGLNALNLNTLNLFFLTLGVALHGTPARLMRAFKDATPGVWGVILQFPLYAGLAALIVKSHLNEVIASFFVSLSSKLTYPALVALYSAVLGIFVPSGGSKWVIEAPYVMQAAKDLGVHQGWMVACYDLGEALANLVQPFWMLPVLSVFGLKARDVMGYTALVFIVLVPVVLVLVTLLGATL
jgi:short-chain fatty acids transporter